MSNDQQKQTRPSHIAYQVRDGAENKAYFNRIGAVWPHKDGEGYDIQLYANPIDGRITIRSVQERVQELKENARDVQGGERRDNARDDKRSSSREDRSPRDVGPRYER